MDIIVINCTVPDKKIANNIAKILSFGKNILTLKTQFHKRL